jgi:hypothetical protein
MTQSAEARESVTSKLNDCAWCSALFDDLVALLGHVESCHLEVPGPDLDAAA